MNKCKTKVRRKGQSEKKMDKMIRVYEEVTEREKFNHRCFNRKPNTKCV